MLFANYQAAIDQIGLSNIDKGFTEDNIRDLFQLKVFHALNVLFALDCAYRKSVIAAGNRAKGSLFKVNL